MVKANTVLVSTHDLRTAGRLREAFHRDDGYEVHLIQEPADLERVSEPRLLILTGRLEEEVEGAFLERARHLDVPTFALAGDVEASRGEARRLGIQEVFSSPPDPDDVVLLARRALRRQDLRRVTGIVGESDPMVGVLDRIVQIAEVDSTVLITGESGTGKELVARGIHHLSPRRAQPFIPVNVAALTDTLLESELFGHEKGAFTGAIDTRKGFFELAHKGTIFLDEVGEMPHATQTKLLRVLEQREFTRVGGEKPIRVDVRIIAATNQDLRQMVALGDFRQDLYYRLNILNVDLPPLRERREDIPVLAESFVREVSQRTGRSFPGISEQAMEMLQAHDWPGNVRELRNLVESMVVLCPDREVRPEDIPAEVRPGRESVLVPARPARRPTAPSRTGEGAESEGEGLRPELEFVFRTLVDLRVDLNDLREEFESYRRRLEEIEEDRDQRAYIIGSTEGAAPGGPGSAPVPRGIPAGGSDEPGARSRTGGPRPGPDDAGLVSRPEEGTGEPPGERTARVPDSRGAGDGTGEEDDDAVVYRPGMTMEDLEKEAIRLALEEVEGNRRKAADRLGIGERTLYRKIRRYGLEG